jgi:outer membrane protein OmpA-like peptidoglycan-associated protein
MADQYVALGDFKGLFKTSQELPLGSTDVFPQGFAHNVRIYKGSLNNTQFEKEYCPENHRQLQSFVLQNVPNIELYGADNGPFQDKRMVTFEQFILIAPHIDCTYQLNGEHYGEISGKAYGITMKNPMIDRLQPDPKPFGDTKLNPDSTIGGLVNDTWDGCSGLLNGCLQNLWKILFYLLLLLTLWWLIRSCNAVVNDNSACDRKEQMREKLSKEEKENEKLKKEYEQRLSRYLKTIPNAFFYKNSTEMYVLSKKQRTLEKWAKAIKVCSDKRFVIIGHHSGNSVENKYKDIDIRRALRIRHLLLLMGVKKDQLQVQGKADKELKYATRLRQFKVGKRTRSYNKNMRVEIQEIK